VFDFCKSHPELSYLCDHFITPLENGDDSQGICLDFVSYTQAMEEAEKSYFESWQKQKEVLSQMVP
jgi:hypothetical protein